MRILAVLVALAGIALVPPAAAGNECVTNAAALVFCQQIDVNNPDPRVPRNDAFDTYFLWVGPGKCMTVSGDCFGTPAGPGSTAGLFGVLYQDTNPLLGLQRSGINVGERFIAADKMVLV